MTHVPHDQDMITTHATEIRTDHRNRVVSVTCMCGWRSAGSYRQDLFHSMALRAVNLAGRIHLDLAEPRDESSHCDCGLDPRTRPCGSWDCVGREVRERYADQLERGRDEAEQVMRGAYTP